MQRAYAVMKLSSWMLIDYDPETGKLVLTGKRATNNERHISRTVQPMPSTIGLPSEELSQGRLFVEVNKGGKVLIKRESMIVKPFRKIRGVEVPNKKAGKRFIEAVL